MYLSSDLKVGVDIQINGIPYKVISNSFIKSGRGRGVMRVNLKNLLSGDMLEKSFKGEEKIEPASIYYTKAQYLFQEGENFIFMDLNSFEQFNLNKNQIGDKICFLKEGLEVDVQNFSNKPINIILPKTITLQVIQTEPGVKGDTAQGGSKPAVLEGNIIVNVPLFIKEGEKIKINTQTKDYIERG